MKLYPLKLRSELKDIIWGGTLLSEDYHQGNPGDQIAEAWVLALRPDGVNTIENGMAAGLTLREYIGICSGAAVCGKELDAFPLLVKLIDAREDLSVQVHPDDQYARSHGLDAGKTELWYVLRAQKGARIVYGLDQTKAPSDAELKNAAENGTLDQYLNYVPVSAGDVFYIPAGLIHAIGGGILIAEIQQNSNTTFRLYDYHRKDKDGRTRPLHVEQALKAADLTLPDGKCAPSEPVVTEYGSYRTLCDCAYFAVSFVVLRPSCRMTFDGGRMLHFVCAQGEGTIVFDQKDYPVKTGDSYLIPAGMGGFALVSQDGGVSVIISMSK